MAEGEQNSTSTKTLDREEQKLSNNLEKKSQNSHTHKHRQAHTQGQTFAENTH